MRPAVLDRMSRLDVEVDDLDVEVECQSSHGLCPTSALVVLPSRGGYIRGLVRETQLPACLAAEWAEASATAAAMPHARVVFIFERDGRTVRVLVVAPTIGGES